MRCDPMMIAAEFARIFRKMGMKGRVCIYLEEPDFIEFRANVDGRDLNMAGTVISRDRKIVIDDVIFQINNKL